MTHAVCKTPPPACTRVRPAFSWPKLPSLPSPPEPEGSAGAWLSFVRSVKSFVEVFPPLGVGVGAGFALGCGLGWPIRRMGGPPRAFCGPGVGIGVGLGYGQGAGKRFGRDRRSAVARERVEKVERAIDGFLKRVVGRLGIGGREKAIPEAGRGAGGVRPVGFVARGGVQLDRRRGGRVVVARHLMA